MLTLFSSLAIEVVEFEENSSVLHDEVLKHRLELLPLTCANIEEFKYNELLNIGYNDIDDFIKQDKCECGNVCKKCAVVLNIDVKNETSEKEIVTNLSLQSENPNVVPFVEKIKIKRKGEDGKTTSSIEEPGTTIIHLRKGERIAAKCYAIKGIGKIHLKFSPVTLATYTYEDPDPRSDDGPDKFYFKVETDGSYSAKQAVQIALKRISNKLLNFSNQLDFIS